VVLAMPAIRLFAGFHHHYLECPFSATSRPTYYKFKRPNPQDAMLAQNCGLGIVVASNGGGEAMAAAVRRGEPFSVGARHPPGGGPLFAHFMSPPERSQRTWPISSAPSEEHLGWLAQFATTATPTSLA
jgi:hypothetical protein